MVLDNNSKWPQSRYDSKINNITTEFFIPALKNSATYRRIGGLFSSTSLALAAKGIHELVRNEGKMELIISPILSKEDALILTEQFEKKKDEIIEKSIKSNLKISPNNFEKNHVDALRYLLKEGFLEIRIHVPRDKGGKILDAESIINQNILAEKRGIFQDRNGKVISFRGPVNENKQSWERGIFSITVDTSWVSGQKQHVHDDIDIFNNLWNGSDTFSLSKELKAELTTYSPKKEEINLEQYDYPTWAILSNGKVLWPHQIRAVNAWINNGCRGIWNIATAGGKTISSLVAVNRLPTENVVIIIVPGKPLISQWEKEIKEFDHDSDIIICDGDHKNWINILPGKINPYLTKNPKPSRENKMYVLATAQTAIGEKFQNIFESINQKFFSVIADEVHHLGAIRYQKVFNIIASERLGLSATFQREWDELGTNKILEYFGRPLNEAEYSISEGIREKRLSQYRYLPFFAHLNHNEFENYINYSRKISQINARVKTSNNDKDFMMEKLEILLIQRAEILKKCEDKLGAYDKIIRSKPNEPYIVFADDNEQVEKLKHVHKEAIKKINSELNEFQNDSISIYSGKSEKWQRKKILEDAKKYKTPIFAMYCLDEGIDVPAFESAILISSSGSKRQYIQRRGRILRTSKRMKVASLYDIIVLPPLKTDLSKKEYASKIIQSETTRIRELSKDAINKWETVKTIEEELEKNR